MSGDATPRDIARMFWIHKKKILLCLLLAVGASLAATAVMKPRYRSEALLFVRLGRENVALDATASMGAGAVVAIPQGREDEINSVVEILRSRGLAEKLVEHFGAETLLGEMPPSNEPTGRVSASASQQFPLSIPEPVARFWQQIFATNEASSHEEAIERIGKRLSVFAPKSSTVINVAYDGPSPELARQVVDKLIEIYLEEHVRLNRTPGTHEFFADQTNEVRLRLTEAEAALRDLKNATSVASVADQRLILVQRIGRLEDDLLKSRAELAACEAELLALDAKLEQLPQTRVSQRVSGLPNQAADGMRQQLYALQLKEQELLSTFQEEARQVQEIRRQITEARGILAKEEYERTQSTNAADPTYAQLHLQLHTKQTVADSLRSKTKAIEQQLGEARTALNELNDDELRLAQLTRDVELAEANYLKYAENLEQARIDQALKLERISNISVAQSASLNPRRVRPNGPMNLLVGIVAGLGLAGMLVVGCEWMRPDSPPAAQQEARAKPERRPLAERESGPIKPAGDRSRRDLATT